MNHTIGCTVGSGYKKKKKQAASLLTPTNECPRYDIKPTNGEYPVLEI